MRAGELLRDLETRGVQLRPHSGHVRVEAPLGTLTHSDRRAIFDNAEALMHLLRGRERVTGEQCERIRAYGRSLGAGGLEWAERLLEPGTVTRQEASELLRWLDRRADHEPYKTTE